MTCNNILYFATLLIGGAMAWAIGANDVANAMASTVGAGILTVTQAIYIAAVFEALGALLASGQVANMMRHGIVDVTLFQLQPELFICGMLAALLAAATWLIIATRYGLPVSTTHSIVGAILGFGVISTGLRHIHWHNITAIAISWILTPITGALGGAVLFLWIQRSILSDRNPFQRCKLQVPFYSAAVVGVFSYIVLFECLDTIGLNIVSQAKIQWWLALILVTYVVSYGALSYQLVQAEKSKREELYHHVERCFTGLAVLTSCGMAFSHGANDVANAIGPIAAILSTIASGKVELDAVLLPFWLVCFGAGAIVLGLICYGYKIMQTVGSHITQITPIRGFCIQFSTSIIVIVASGLGIPVSTTQTMIGSIFGVGLVRGLQAVNTQMVGNIFLSWVITLPAGSLLAMLYYRIFTWGYVIYGYICYR